MIGTLNNARPLAYCSECVDFYVDVKNSFIELNKMDNEYNISCENELLRADKFQIILKVWDFISDTWATSTCDKCFDIRNGSYHMKMETLKLAQLLETTLECFSVFNKTSSDLKICEYCKSLYEASNDYYIDSEQKDILCADIIDTMNYTRIEWGATFHCYEAKRKGDGVFIITAIIGFLTFLLYFCSYYFQKNSDN